MVTVIFNHQKSIATSCLIIWTTGSSGRLKHESFLGSWLWYGWCDTSSIPYVLRLESVEHSTRLATVLEHHQLTIQTREGMRADSRDRKASGAAITSPMRR